MKHYILPALLFALVILLSILLQLKEDCNIQYTAVEPMAQYIDSDEVLVTASGKDTAGYEVLMTTLENKGN